ncbi:Cytochrome c553 [Polynucleobacter meluiroseus]|jgi:cytochrome subunit of sulfide dehydrogenase|uniref:Cytochrome c553 n=1 Tax=Polynucleobacter meluiroseus TaxID=1938814 RepID=A0A240E269_9BURK|nr:c-type cytochrome [Polynucleobacter meluiroseus]SNX29327.1 Cytochrome c553 [Polynucleobacter meluiroseus]
MPYLKSAILVVALLGLSQWSQAGEQTAEQLYQRSLAATCANCHGTDGKGLVNGSIPQINQLSSGEILAQLLAYKSGARAGTIMPQLAKGYTDEQLTTIAEQLGKKP